MKPDLVVKNAKVVNSLGTYEGHILVKDGKVLAMASELNGEPESVINAEGLHVIPGMVDDHVHMMDPGHTEREDFTTGTQASARGGATTVIEHHRTLPPVFLGGPPAREERIPERQIRRRFRPARRAGARQPP